MLKAQLARALQLPMDTRAEQGLRLLRELDEPTEESDPEESGASEECAAEGGSTPRRKADSDAHDCDRVIATLRARLAAR